MVVLDLLGIDNPQLAGLALPILDQLRPELDFSRPGRAAGEFSAAGIAPVAEGSFTPEVNWQNVVLESPISGRYLCVESLNAHDGGNCATIAELDILDENGQSLSKLDWKALWADSEEILEDDGTAENAFDGQTASTWQTRWSHNPPPHPHQIVLDLGSSVTVSTLRYLPRSGGENERGRIKDFRLYLSNEAFGLVVEDGGSFSGSEFHLTQPAEVALSVKAIAA